MSPRAAFVARSSRSLPEATRSGSAAVMASTKEAPAGPAKRGAFILFEGVDRCGKTTQANLLVESLKQAGHDACFMRFPGEKRT